VAAVRDLRALDVRGEYFKIKRIRDKVAPYSKSKTLVYKQAYSAGNKQANRRKKEFSNQVARMEIIDDVLSRAMFKPSLEATMAYVDGAVAALLRNVPDL
jgi:hypothetical protein